MYADLRGKSVAFFDAIKSGDLAEVQLYVCAGIDVKALRHGPQEWNSWSPLFCAAHDNRLEIVEYFIRSGHDLEVGVNTGDMSPLFIAADGGNILIVRCLVEQGARTDVADFIGNTPLLMASRQGHFEVARYLVEHGADKDNADEDGITPLLQACREGHMDVRGAGCRQGQG